MVKGKAMIFTDDEESQSLEAKPLRTSDLINYEKLVRDVQAKRHELVDAPYSMSKLLELHGAAFEHTFITPLDNDDSLKSISSGLQLSIAPGGPAAPTEHDLPGRGLSEHLKDSLKALRKAIFEWGVGRRVLSQNKNVAASLPAGPGIYLSGELQLTIRDALLTAPALAPSQSQGNGN